MTLQKKTEVRILTEDLRRILAVFFKMTSYPSFELIEAKSDPISKLGNICVSLELLPLRKKCFRTSKKKDLIILNKKWNHDIDF